MHVIKRLPKNISVAVSGGVDSVVLLHFLHAKKHDITAVHYVHNTEFAEKEAEFVSNLCRKLCIPLTINTIIEPRNIALSKEEDWRTARYKFFTSLDELVCTGHTLDDMVEWYLFTSLMGEGRYMEYAHSNVVRPFICTKKSDILEYAIKHNISWLEDPSNKDANFAARNRIRYEILPAALKVNPGLYKTVSNRFQLKYKRGMNNYGN